jgi:hypothetical protein
VRERLRASLGFCRVHARMAVDKNLANALGFAIIYQDVINNILKQWKGDSELPRTRRWSTLLQRVPEQIGELVQRVLYTLTPQKHCVACQQRDRTIHLVLSSLMEGLQEPEMQEALRMSEGLCPMCVMCYFQSIATNSKACAPSLQNLSAKMIIVSRMKALVQKATHGGVPSAG